MDSGPSSPSPFVEKLVIAAAAANSSNNQSGGGGAQNFMDKPMKYPLDPAVCQKAARYAVRVYEEMSKRSNLLRNQKVQVAQFERSEVLPHIGDLLGKGGFNSVYELRHDAVLVDVESGRTVKNTKDRLAVKFLSDDAMMVADEFCNGAADLLMEANYLKALAAHPHPALIQLHGICRDGANGFCKTERAGFFLVIDRLYDTLDRRMDVWKELSRRRAGQDLVLQALFLQRLIVAQDIAAAIRHLQRLNIVFRDLKPDNVGFDFEGRVKIFDFGLAKELDPKQKNDDGLYHMSGGTGSRRFMAPEVSLSEPYTLSADMYSFAILFWELLTLQKAFGYMPVEEHHDMVVKGGERPELDPSWSTAIKEILEGCWNPNPFARPAARDVCKAIRQEIQTMYQEQFGQPYADNSTN